MGPSRVWSGVTISRRRLLIGAGAVVVAGGAAAAAELPNGRRERLLARAGLEHSPDHHVPDSGAREVSGRLASRHTGRDMSWTMSTPADGSAPRALLVCLHGAGADHRMAFDGLHVPDVAASLGLPLAVAAVDGGADSYWHRRADGSDAQAMLLQEFLPLTRQRLGPLPLAVMGWSMGGYGALLAAQQAPRTFRAVAVGSPALWTSCADSAPGAFDGAADFAAHRVQGSPLPVALACGSGDPFYPTSSALATRLSGPHAVEFGHGFHDDAYWRSVAPAQLTFLGAHL